jgi:hypothetical protein
MTTLFKNNKYTRWYYIIINNATMAKRSKKLNYFESHHIIPKSFGGSNSKNNRVLLTGREHYVCHMLLVRMVYNENVYKMINAIRRFKKKSITSKEFENIRRTMSKFSKGALNASFDKIWIYNIQTNDILYVKKDKFETMDKNIFIRGLPYQRGGHRNTIWINNGIDETCILPEIFINFDSTWVKGRLNPPDTSHMKSMSAKRHTIEKDKEHSEKLSGRITIKHPITNVVKRILPKQLPEYKQQGYIDDAVITTSLSHKCQIDGIVYDSLGDAAQAFNIPKNAVYYRLCSKLTKWSKWQQL